MNWQSDELVGDESPVWLRSSASRDADSRQEAMTTSDLLLLARDRQQSEKHRTTQSGTQGTTKRPAAPAEWGARPGPLRMELGAVHHGMNVVLHDLRHLLEVPSHRRPQHHPSTELGTPGDPLSLV